MRVEISLAFTHAQGLYKKVVASVVMAQGVKGRVKYNYRPRSSDHVTYSSITCVSWYLSSNMRSFKAKVMGEFYDQTRELKAN